MPKIELHETYCPICRTAGNAAELYAANFSAADFNASVFSARRIPDRLRYRIVKCLSCGLVRSDPIAGHDIISELYSISTLDYSCEIPNLQKTYSSYLRRIAKYSPFKNSLLEIGCGNGFFLEEALKHGYNEVCGVEPSAAAAQKASAAVRKKIHTGIMQPGIFEDNHFDVVCLFQVLDHIPEPAALLEQCLKVLKPGGALLVLNHNVDAFSAKLLGEYSPIVDIEHTFLYGDKTLPRLAESCGFKIAEAGAALNYYSINYLLRLIPLPGRLKQAVLRLADSIGAGKITIKMPLGNMYLIAVKPASGSLQ